MTTNREQEVVELSLKGCLRIIGIAFPKVHDAGYVFTKEVGKKLVFQESTLGERDFTSEDSKRAYNDAAFVLREIIIRTRSESRN